MPRNYARERAKADQEAPARMQETFAQLSKYLGDRDVVLIGWRRILPYLYEIGVRRPNGKHVYQLQVLRWRARYGFPLVRGASTGRTLTPPMTSHHAIIAWLCAQVDTGSRDLFRLYSTPESAEQRGSRAGAKTAA